MKIRLLLVLTGLAIGFVALAGSQEHLKANTK
jgi:hypothetical protein